MNFSCWLCMILSVTSVELSMHILLQPRVQTLYTRASNAFVGLRFKSPETVCRSDAAAELSLPRRWPHNAICERMIRTFDECCCCLHLHAGLPIAMMPKLWTVTCRYAAVAISIDKWETAIRGAKSQLCPFYRTKSQYKPELDPNAFPALMAGWKLEFGLRYKGVLIVLDYAALREGKKLCVSKCRTKKFTLVIPFLFPFADAAERSILSRNSR